jgi:hypothetical protein
MIAWVIILAFLVGCVVGASLALYRLPEPPPHRSRPADDPCVPIDDDDGHQFSYWSGPYPSPDGRMWQERRCTLPGCFAGQWRPSTSKPRLSRESALELAWRLALDPARDPIGVCVRCGLAAVRYSTDDTTEVVCGACGWVGDDSDVLGKPVG